MQHTRCTEICTQIDMRIFVICEFLQDEKRKRILIIIIINVKNISEFVFIESICIFLYCVRVTYATVGIRTKICWACWMLLAFCFRQFWCGSSNQMDPIDALPPAFSGDSAIADAFYLAADNNHRVQKTIWQNLVYLRIPETIRVR